MPAEKKSPYLSDIWSKTDALSFDTFKPALMQIVEQAETPLTVGVFGTWGSGKTTLLRMLKSEIDGKRLPSFKAIWFTAWKYEQQEALWRSFILRVIDGLYPKDENGNRYPLDQLTDKDQRKGAEELEHLERSVYETVSWEEEGKWTIDSGELAKQAIHIPIWLAFHLAGQGVAGGELGINPDLAAMLERKVREHHLNQLISMEQFEATFQNAIKLILGEEGRLVVFVDDLDRCLPEKSIEVLEAIKLFLDVPGTVFVLGMDREVIRRGIESHYDALLKGDPISRDEIPINGDVYLQKMIQLPFNLPPLDLHARNEFIEKLEDTLPADFHLEEVTRQVFAHGLYPNPRQVKRALNVFYLLKNIALEQEDRKLIPQDILSWPLLAKTVLIQSQWPELYQLWRQYPTLIQTLEDEYTRQPVSENEILGGIQRIENVQSDEGLKLNQEKLGSRQSRSEDRPKATGLIAPFLNDRQKYSLLGELLRYPQATDLLKSPIFSNGMGKGRLRAHFVDLTRTQIQIYVGLVGAVELIPEAPTSASFMPDNIIEELESGDLARIREISAVVKEKEPESQGPQHKKLANQLIAISLSTNLPPKNRALAADALDDLGWLPEDQDLYTFIPISEGIQPSLFVAKYPVSNIQYKRFLDAPDFGQKELWMNFPYFDEESQQMRGNWSDKGWKWFQSVLQDKKLSSNGNILYPASWNDPKFGISRKCVPLVNINWFEANAYCRWLTKHWNELEEGRINTFVYPGIVRLPTEKEWILFAGGVQPSDRYPWDRPGEMTKDIREIIQRANIGESNINRTTPVWLYPLGATPEGVMDLTGNTWEWQANYFAINHKWLSLRGGSWASNRDNGRVVARDDFDPSNRDHDIGFRVVCIPS